MNERELIELLRSINSNYIRIEVKLDLILKEQHTMATSQADFDVALANLSTQLDAGLTTIQTAITDLINKIQAGVPVDLTNELTSVNQMAANLQTAVTTAQGEDPGPTTPPVTTSTV